MHWQIRIHYIQNQGHPLAKGGLATHNRKQSNEKDCCHYKICRGINLQLCKLLNDVKPFTNFEFSSALNVSLQSKILPPGKFAVLIYIGLRWATFWASYAYDTPYTRMGRVNFAHDFNKMRMRRVSARGIRVWHSHTRMIRLVFCLGLLRNAYGTCGWLSHTRIRRAIRVWAALTWIFFLSCLSQLLCS